MSAVATFTVEFARRPPPMSVPAAVGRIPRICRSLAFAHRVDQMIRDGEVENLAFAARWAGVSRARLSQVLGLLSLAPAIQGELLGLPRITTGRDQWTERKLRPVAAELSWELQLQRWNSMHEEAE